MDIKELSVGNFVYLKNGKLLQGLQVTGIGDSFVNLKTSDEYPNVLYPLNDIEPIPLTTEILEKNGFKFLIEDEKYKTLCLNEHYINCTFVKEFKDWMITAGAAGSLKKRFVEVSKVQFVHEMQHLLRLCRYELDLKI